MKKHIPPYTITSKMVNLISLISEAISKIESSQQPIITPKLRKINRIKTLAGTLEIEGNFLGEEKITAILEGKRVLGTYEEVTEAESAIRAYKEFENYNPYTIESLLYAHKLMMGGMLTTAGSFRSVNVGVGNQDGVSHVAPPHGVVPELMHQLFDWLEACDAHPLIKACVFHYEFEFIHPFSDGNGRIGRLWQSVILYHWKQPFIAIATESIVRDHQEAYYQALEDAGTAGESTPFVEFMLEVIHESIVSSVKGSVKGSVNTEEKILLHLRENPTATIKALSEVLGLSTRAIEKQIAKLKTEGRLQRIGSARKGHWEVKREEIDD
jgi:Fic family protein